MNVLFVCREKSHSQISPIVTEQFRSLKNDVDITIFPITGKGAFSYIKAISRLKKLLKNQHFDIVHAHYAFSAFIASISTSKPVVCSLMGSDIESCSLTRFIIRQFAKYSWESTIVKSQSLKIKLGLPRVSIVPNGVNMDLFKPIQREKAREKVGYDPGKIIVLFPADPARKEKNFRLAQQAYNLLPNKETVELKVVYDADISLMPYYLSAADVILVTSYFEGSPNIIKEALACNANIVATPVGDIEEITARLNTFICDFSPESLSEGIMNAITSAKKPDNISRDRIYSIGLDSGSIAKRILKIYKTVSPNILNK